jgi:hypothetical protein
MDLFSLGSKQLDLVLTGVENICDALLFVNAGNLKPNS